MSVYIFNTTIVPIDTNAIILFKKVSIEYVKEFLKKNEFTSAIGHSATAEVLSELTGLDIPMNRIQVLLQSGDIVVAFKLKDRLQEGVILTKEELEKLEYDLFMMHVFCYE